MQLNSEADIAKVALAANFCIIEIPKSLEQEKILPNSYHLRKNEKGIILIEQIRELATITRAKQSSDAIIVIENATNMTEGAANAFLKALEEPTDKIHYLFLVTNSATLLPTIKSRAQCYFIADKNKIADPPKMSEADKNAAREFISADQKNLVAIADKIAKLKEGKRETALKLVENAIELTYKSYFITGNEKLLTKLEKLNKTHEALSANGNIRLQLVANML